jgi:hypothetical protein
MCRCCSPQSIHHQHPSCCGHWCQHLALKRHFDLPGLIWGHASEAENNEAGNLSALPLACDSGDIQLARLLINHAVKIDAFDGNRRGALHCASHRLQMNIHETASLEWCLGRRGKKGQIISARTCGPHWARNRARYQVAFGSHSHSFTGRRRFDASIML